MGSHLAQPGKHSLDMFIRIYERDDDGQLASGLNEMCSVYTASSLKSGNRVECDCASDIFLP